MPPIVTHKTDLGLAKDTGKNKDKTSWPRRALRYGLGFILILILAILGLRGFITTTSGARFLEGQINKRSLGPLERVEISGLSGDPLSEFSVKSIAIYDKDGLWLSAYDFNLSWRPFAYLKDHIWIENLTIGKANILRRPTLNSSQTTTPTAPGKTRRKVSLGNYTLSRVNINEALIGQAVNFESSGQFKSLANGAVTARLTALRLDTLVDGLNRDSLNIDFNRTASGVLSGIFAVKSAAGGPIAALLKAPNNQAVLGSGDISGMRSKGAGHFNLTIGGIDALKTQIIWTPQSLEASADLNTSTLNLEGDKRLDTLRTQLGAKAELTLTVGRTAAAQSFATRIAARDVTLTVSGNLPEAGPNTGYLPNRANIELTAAQLSNIIRLPDDFKAGEIRLKGLAALTAPYAFDGTLSLTDVATPYISVKQLNGPLTLASNGAEYDFRTDWRFNGTKSAQALPFKLAEKIQLNTVGTFDPVQSRIALKSVALTSGEDTLRLNGKLRTDFETLDINGALNTAIHNPNDAHRLGQLKADFLLRKTQASPVAFTTDGAFKPNRTLPAPFKDLIGDTLIFETDISPQDNGLSIDTARIFGDNINLALNGDLGDRLNISGEFLTSAPIELASLNIADETETRFTLTGPRGTPNLDIEAKTAVIDLGGTVLEAPHIRARLSDILSAPKGPLKITANTEYGPISLGTEFASTSNDFKAEDILFNLGPLDVTGQLALPKDNPRIITGQIDLNLIPDDDANNTARTDATLKLSNKLGEQAIALTATGQNVTLLGLYFDNFEANANGGLSNLTGDMRAEGARGNSVSARDFKLAAPFSMTKDTSETYSITLSPELQYGNIIAATRAPILGTYTSGAITVRAPFSVSGQPIDIAYEKTQSSELLTLKAESLPLSLVALPDLLAETRGEISADIELSTQQNAPLKGRGLLTLKDWRGFDTPKGEGLSLKSSLSIDGPQSNIDLTANSAAGFSADGQMKLAIIPARNLAATRLDFTAPISGQLTASGQAAAILGLIAQSDTELGGTLSVELGLSGTANTPNVTGQVNGQNIRFEAPSLGTQIRKARFAANFTNDTLSVSDIYVSDADKGSLTGNGDFKLGKYGRPIGALNLRADDFSAIDRRDVSAKLNGAIDVMSREDGAKIMGDVTLKRTEVKQFVSGGVAVIEIDVEEINRPETAKNVTVEKPSTPIDLDVRLRAPRRLFIRSRGLDVEMSLDANIKGTSAEPLIYGETNVLRGGYKIAGKTLDFEAGRIEFNGAIPNAIVNFKAVADTQNLQATVSITGTVKEPEITLSSRPERPQDEILSALLFGRSVTELSAIEAAQLAGALAQFSGRGGGFDLLGGVRDAFGIGQLSVSVDEGGAVQLVGGRYLAKNVYLQVFSGAGPDQTGALIDWEIRKNLALSSRLRADNDQALSLKWKRNF